MQTLIGWPEVALRLGLTLVAGIIIGINRGENGGRPAGLRTTVLVCLTASCSMILANLLLGTVGKAGNSYVNIDVMRLPLGILTGIGFIGAGTILRKSSLVTGVTTAATMWFVTMMGFCFGSGEKELGGALLGLGVFVLWGLKWVESKWKRRQEANVTITMEKDGVSTDEIIAALTTAGRSVALLGMENTPAHRLLRFEVFWIGKPRETTPPDYLQRLEALPGVSSVSWSKVVKG